MIIISTIEKVRAPSRIESCEGLGEQMTDMLGSLEPCHPDQCRDDDQNGKDGNADQSPKPVVQVERNGRDELHLRVVSAEAVFAEHRQRTPEEDDLTHYSERNGQIHQRPRHPQFSAEENRDDEDDMERFRSNTEVQPVFPGHYDTSVSVWNVLSSYQSPIYLTDASIAYMSLKVKPMYWMGTLVTLYDACNENLWAVSSRGIDGVF